MSSFDRESFHLLQMSDSMSDSLPDLDLVVPSNSKKKKVRLKRFVLLDNRQIKECIISLKKKIFCNCFSILIPYLDGYCQRWPHIF